MVRRMERSLWGQRVEGGGLYKDLVALVLCCSVKGVCSIACVYSLERAKLMEAMAPLDALSPQPRLPKRRAKLSGKGYVIREGLGYKVMFSVCVCAGEVC